MTAAAWAGAGVGALAAGGLLLAVRSAPPLRRPRLADRLAPYLGEAPAPSRLLGRPSGARLGGAVLAGLVARLDRIVGGAASVRRRTAGLGGRMSVEEFRVEQVVWGAVGLLASAVLTLVLGALRGGVDPLLVGLAIVGGGVGGVLGRDWWLSRELHRREQVMLGELPVVADLLALAVAAGEAPVDALDRVARVTGGELAGDLAQALARARAGTPLATALGDLADRTTLEPFARFVDGLLVAIERGTPLAGVLRAQAVDVREAGKRALIESGGRREIAMLVPVVFLVLPVTVLFALFPGLLTLTSLTH